MLTLLLGSDWVQNRDVVIEMLAADVASGKGNRVLLVPELISHDAERRLCAAAGDTATLYAEVVTFTRMIRAVSDCVGKGAEPCLDNGGRLVAMAATTRQLHSVLKAYASLETKPEFLTELVSAVDEFKQCCITSADLAKAASMSTGTLAQKLEELALILDTYDGICRQSKVDPADKMNWLLEQMEDCTYARDRVFYIDGFPDFTRQHMAIVEHIILHSPNVTVSINCDRFDSDNMAFEKTADTAAQLLRFAKGNGVPVEICYIDHDCCSLSEIRSKLYRGDTVADDQFKECLAVYHANSVYQECVAAAQYIRSIINRGDRYRDFSVVCPNINGYKNTLTSVFRRFNIPLYISGTENILERPVIIALLTAVDAALGGFETRQVLNYLKSSICPLSPDACDEIENYAYCWNIQGSLWSQEWTMHPDGIGMQWRKKDEELIARLNKARDKAIKPLLIFQKAFQNAKNLSEQVHALYRFIEDIQLSETFQRLADIADSNEDHRNAQIFNQLWEILIAALEQLHDVLGTTVWDAETFARLLRLLLTQYDIGTIPPVLDSVVAGPTNAMRCHEAKHLLVLGADEGSFPAYCGATGVLSDLERNALRAMGVSVLSGAESSLQGEFYNIYGVFCGARKTVYISAGPGQPSFVFRRLAQLCDGEKPILDTPALYVGDRTDAGALLTRLEDSETANDLGLTDVYHDLTDAKNYELGKIAPEQIRELYGETLRLSPSSVEVQAKCRLQYFLKYGLRVKEQEPYCVDPAQFGTYVHDVLENTAKDVMARGGFRQVSLEDTLDIARVYSDRYIQENFSQIESVRQNYLLQRNLDELLAVVEELWQEMSQSQFDPTFFELEFGKNSGIAEIPIENADMPASLNGKVDRVDTLTENGRNYFRVVDYKSGKNIVLDYCNIQNGMGLQMLLYMFALEEMGEDVLGMNAQPAGVLYFPARMNVLNQKSYPDDKKVEKERRDDWQRSSLLLKDNGVLEAMCADLQKIGIKVDKEGNLNGDIVTPQQFDMLKGYIKKIMAGLVNDIASGCVDANPYNRGERLNACVYCKFASICHPGENAQPRDLAEIRFKDFWERLEGEMSKNG